MADLLKLGPLPQQKTVKVPIVLSESFKEELDAYAVEHGRIHNHSATTAELIPHILQTFLRDDRAWYRLRKQRGERRTGQRRLDHQPSKTVVAREEAEKE